jgi:hypothetical protein
VKIPSARLVLFNAAAVLIAASAVVAVLRSFLAPSSLVPCTQRYQTTMVFPLERDGAMVTPADIEARSGSQDAAALRNLEIVRISGGSAQIGMSVALPKGLAAPATGAAEESGISFPWQPRSLRNKSAVCLSYSLLLPADFNFGLGGTLPGIVGQTDLSGDRFAVQAVWGQGGDVGAASVVTLAGQKSRRDLEGGTQIRRGLWVKVEQEVVLNDPGQDNGTVRLWIDGAMAIDRGDVNLRAKPDVSLTGVAVNLHYSGDDVMSRSPADAKVLIAPLALHWK